MGCDGLVVSGLLSHNPGIDAARVEPQFDQFGYERQAMKATPLGVGSSLYPITDTTADSLCDKVDDGDRQWKELVGTCLDNVGIMDAQISQPNQCIQIYGTGLCKCDLPLADESQSSITNGRFGHWRVWLGLRRMQTSRLWSRCCSFP